MKTIADTLRVGRSNLAVQAGREPSRRGEVGVRVSDREEGGAPVNVKRVYIAGTARRSRAEPKGT